MRESSKLRFTGGVRRSTARVGVVQSLPKFMSPRWRTATSCYNPVQSKGTNYSGVDDGMGVYALNSFASLGFDRGKTYRLRVTD
jgi:hypothetical protein